MGFLTSTTTDDRQPSPRSFPNAVSRVLGSCGLNRIETVGAPSDHVQTAMGAVNDALEYIITQTKWDWRVRWIQFRMEDKVFAYPAPADYAEFAAGPINSNRPGQTLPFMAYEDLVQKHPGLHTHVGEVMAGPNLAELQNITTAVLSEYTGIPEVWSFFGGYLFLFPIPNIASSLYPQGYVDEAAFDADKIMMLAYHPTFKELVSDTDVVPLPYTLLVAHHFLSLAYFKQAKEYPDFQADEARGERMLVKAVTKNRHIYDSKFRFQAEDSI